MKSLTFSLFILASKLVFCQSNLSVFNNGGQRFYLIMNGIKQNSIPQTNVSVSGIKDGGYSIKLIFEDGKTSDIDKNFFIDCPSDITTRVVFKKGKGKIQLVSILPTNGTIQESAVTFRPNDTFIYTDQQPVQTNQVVPVLTNPTSTNQPVNTTFNTSNQTSNATISSNQQQGNLNNNTNISTNLSVNNPPQNVQLNLGVNMNGLNETSTELLNGGVNMNISLNGGMNETQTTTTQTTTTITQSQSGTISNNSNVAQNQPVLNSSPNANNQNNVATINTNSTINNQITNVNSNCARTIIDFDGFLADLKSQTFEDDKMETIKKDLISTCVYHQQAYNILETLTFEANRFEIAKFLYVRTLDRQLSERGILPLFTFDSTKMDWRDFVRNLR